MKIVPFKSRQRFGPLVSQLFEICCPVCGQITRVSAYEIEHGWTRVVYRKCGHEKFVGASGGGSISATEYYAKHCAERRTS